MRILVIRPEREARATAARLAALGHEAIVAPTMRVEFDTTIALPREGVAALLVTSANAVDALGRRSDLSSLVDLPVYAVGRRTAEAARAAGFARVVSADGDRHALLDTVAAARSLADGRLLWAAGRDRTGDLPGEFAARGFEVVTVEVYRAEAVDGLPETVIAAFRAREIDAVTIHSPRSAALLVERLVAAGLDPASPGSSFHAISEAAAQPLREAGCADVIVAARPDETALLETFGRSSPVPAGPENDAPWRSSMARKSDKTRGSAAEPGEPDAVTAPPAEEAAANPTPVETVEASEAGEVVVTAPEPIETPVEAAEAVVPAPVETEAVVAETVAPEAPVIEPVVEPVAVPPSPAPVAAPPRGGKGGLVAATVVASVLGGAIGIGGSQYLAERKAPPSAPATESNARLEALDGRLAAIEGRLGALGDLGGRIGGVEAKVGAMKPTDLSGIESRLAKIEAAPALTLPGDVATRITGLEKAAEERLAAAKTSVGEALAKLPEDTGARAAIAELAGRVDAAVSAAREASAGEIARLRAELAARQGELNAWTAAIGGDIDRALTATREATVTEIARLKGEIETRQAEIAARGGSVGDDVKAALQGTQERLAAEVERRSAEVAAMVEGLRQRMGGLEGLRGEVDGLIGRLGGLESSNKEAKVDRGRIVETLDATRSATEGRVGSVESKLATLEAGAEAARAAQAEAVFAVALADLKSAVDAGRPFQGEYDVVKRAAPQGTTLSLAAIDPFVATGVPSVTALRDGLPRVVRAMHEAKEAEAAGPGPLDRLMSHAGQLVRVRPAGETAGTDVGALISRLEGRLVAGDLPGALAAWKALPETSRKAAAPWGAALEARVTVDAALAAQTAAVVSKLSQPRP